MSETYELEGTVAGDHLDELAAGTNVAIVGPSMSGKRELALELLARGYDTGEGILCVTTDSAETVYGDLERHVDSLDRNRVGIVDTSGSDGRESLDAMTEYVSSPSDLTGISIGTAKLFQQFRTNGISDIRYGLISISTLLQYMESRKVFKFLHIYTKRIESTGALGIYTLDTDTHDERVVNTIRSQFDGVIELDETDAGDLQFRARGFGRRPTQWKPL